MKLTATYLYADLAKSTVLARDFESLSAAKVIRSFLDASCRVLEARGATILSFDGDRVMGVFVGTSRNEDAARAALQINYAVAEVLRPKLYSALPALRRRGFVINHGVGIAEGQTLIVRGGVRGTNDLVSVGRAANVAAKLSDRRDNGYSSFITAAVYNRLSAEPTYNGAGRKTHMWSQLRAKVGGRELVLYRSNKSVPL